MSFELETRRNQWVAQQLGVEKVYRDDNVFVRDDDDYGFPAAWIVTAGSGQLLMIPRTDGGGQTPVVVPDDILLPGMV